MSFTNTLDMLEGAGVKEFLCPQCNGETLRLYPAITSADVPIRWLCKECGYYYSKRYGERQCVPDMSRGVWMFKEDATNPDQPTPWQTRKLKS